MARKTAISDDKKRERNRDAQRKHRFKKAARIRNIEERLGKYEDFFRDLRAAKSQQNMSQLLTLVDNAEKYLWSGVSCHDSQELTVYNPEPKSISTEIFDNVLSDDRILPLCPYPVENSCQGLNFVDNIIGNMPLLLGSQEMITAELFGSQYLLGAGWDQV
jgi:hypothetical protein